MKLAAREMGSLKAVKESLKRGSGSSEQWIKNIPAEGITVRFLTEPEQWFGYYEYYDAANKAFVPMAEGEILPDGAKKSFRYLAAVIDIESDRVVPLKLPKTAANALILKYDKYGSMMDRDYELERFGEGLDTTYDVTPTAPEPRNMSKYELPDLEALLVAARQKALGEADIDSDVFPAESIDNDVPVQAAAVLDEDRSDRLGDDDDDDASGSGDPNGVDLLSMSIRELRLLALENDIDPRGRTKTELVDVLLEELEV